MGNDRVVKWFFEDENLIKKSLDIYEKSVYAQEIEQIAYFFFDIKMQF